MTGARTYLDYNASAPLRHEARAAMVAALDLEGNPSSVHREGRAARALIEAAREDVAALVGMRAMDVTFTSGGTEAANAVVRNGYDVVLMADIEHDCVRAAQAASRSRHVTIAVDRHGVISLESLSAALSGLDAKPARALLALQLANNETGVIQPVAEAAAIARDAGADVFVDAVQAAGKMPISFGALGAHALALSAHKIGGPKGVGAIVSAPDWRLAPFLQGGGQEKRRRAGTENVAGIAGFGAAARSAVRDLGVFDHIRELRDDLERRAKVLTPDVKIAGEGAARLGNTSALLMPEVAAETALIRFDLAGIAVSSGSACSSGKVGRSHVLAAMGLGARAGNAIRVSLGWNSTEDDVERFLETWRTIHAPAERRSIA
ncbi:MAG: cysteine desulfurase family protein [Hyphomicrobium sp.]|nr:cysteine desulfurase family protein [Hyphomicrobium sp.]